jgi:hypothetical protein
MNTAKISNYNVIGRIIKWNNVRYGQNYDSLLTIKLLEEELEELQNAKTTVEILDACADIIFIAIGAAWKLGLSILLLETLFYTVKIQNGSDHCRELIFDTLLSLPINISEDIKLLIQSVFSIVIPKLRSILSIKTDFFTLMNIICTSNETKSVHKTPAYKKYLVGKGPNYVPPTEALKNFVNFLQQRNR